MHRINIFSLKLVILIVVVGCGGSQQVNRGTETTATTVKPVPDGFRTITPNVTVQGVAKAIDFYKQAFAAKEHFVFKDHEGKLMHVELRIGDSIIMINEENPQWEAKSPKTLGATPVSIQLFVNDVDTVFAAAVAAGATARMPVQDQFWGDRYGEVTDPFGHRWGIATRIENLAPEEILARAKAAFSKHDTKDRQAPQRKKPAKGVQSVPEGFHTVTPWLVVGKASEAIDFYKQALGAIELTRLPSPDGRVMYALLRIGDSNVMLSDEFPEMGSKSPQTVGGTPVGFMVYVEDVDATFDTVVANKATVKMPVADMFWGDRYGAVIDPFGHHWGLATHKENLTPEQMLERMKEQMSKPKTDVTAAKPE